MIAEGKNPNGDSPVIFFDGVCGLCDRFVTWVLRVDQKGVFKFAPLQGETAKNLNLGAEQELLKSIVLKDEDGLHFRSEAVFRILRRLGGIWRVPAAFRILPRFITDGAYAWIAKNRYAWFGKSESCRLPKPEEKERFLP